MNDEVQSGSARAGEAVDYTKVRVDIALAEFNALRAEISSRMTAQTTLVGVSLTALGVIVGFVVKDTGDPRLLLAIPALAAAVNYLLAIENGQVTQIGKYIREQLWVRLAYLTNQDIGDASKEPCRMPSWEAVGTKGGLFRSLAADLPTPTILATAAVTALAVYRASFWGKDYHTLWWVDIVLTVFAIAVPIRTAVGNSKRRKGTRSPRQPGDSGTEPPRR